MSVSGQTGSTGAVVYTDSAGQACLDNLSVPNNLFGSNTGSANVQVSASGYTTQSITVQLTGGQTTSQLFQMSYSAAKQPLSQYRSTIGYTLILVGAAVTGAGFFTGKKEPES